MKKKLYSIGLVIMLMTTFTACASLIGPTPNPLSITSSPEGSEVYLNGTKIGITPLQLKLIADRSYTFEFRKEGYEPIVKVVKSKVSVGRVLTRNVRNWKGLDQKVVDAVLQQR